MLIRTRRTDPEARQRDLEASYRYGLVLLLVVASFLVAATAPTSNVTRGVLVVLLCGTLAAAFWTARLGRIGLKLALVGAGAVIAVVELLVGGKGVEGAVGILQGLLVLAIIVVIARGVLSQAEINDRSVLGAICVYLLIGMGFVFLYGVVAVLGSGPLFAQGTDGTGPERVYFSFVTLTTVGYGDFTTASDLGHTLAIIEALMGQLYLVTVLALLVSRVRGRRTA